MTPQPTGLIRLTGGGRDLVLTRTFRADIDDVWASMTEPERTARWFGTWSGEAGPGKTIRFRPTFEEGAPESDMVIDACEPPHHLAVSTVDENGAWYLEAQLEQSGDTTTLLFTHHLHDDVDAGSVGPGWEYYLDMLVASRDGSPQPNFDDYFPAQQAHYESFGQT